MLKNNSGKSKDDDDDENVDIWRELLSNRWQLGSGHPFALTAATTTAIFLSVHYDDDDDNNNDDVDGNDDDDIPVLVILHPDTVTLSGCCTLTDRLKTKVTPIQNTATIWRLLAPSSRLHYLVFQSGRWQEKYPYWHWLVITSVILGLVFTIFHKQVAHWHIFGKSFTHKRIIGTHMYFIGTHMYFIDTLYRFYHHDGASSQPI